MLQLQRYDFVVHHIRGTSIPVADTLSRKPLADTYPELSEGMDSMVHSIISSLPGSDRKLEKIRLKTEQDAQLSCLNETISQGWPNLRKQCPTQILEYWNFRDQLTIINGLVMNGEKNHYSARITSRNAM